MDISCLFESLKLLNNILLYTDNSIKWFYLSYFYIKDNLNSTNTESSIHSFLLNKYKTKSIRYSSCYKKCINGKTFTLSYIKHNFRMHELDTILLMKLKDVCSGAFCVRFLNALEQNYQRGSCYLTHYANFGKRALKSIGFPDINKNLSHSKRLQFKTRIVNCRYLRASEKEKFIKKIYELAHQGITFNAFHHKSILYDVIKNDFVFLDIFSCNNAKKREVTKKYEALFKVFSSKNTTFKTKKKIIKLHYPQVTNKFIKHINTLVSLMSQTSKKNVDMYILKSKTTFSYVFWNYPELMHLMHSFESCVHFVRSLS